MGSPLDAFIRALPKRENSGPPSIRRQDTHTSSSDPKISAGMECELTLASSRTETPDCSLPAHTHTIEPFIKETAEMECDPKCEDPLTLREPPLQAGWLVAYRDMTGKLRGGFDEREHGTVAECRWKGNEWVIALTDGGGLPGRIIRAVSRVNAEGRIVEAWTVASHGLDGRKHADWEPQDVSSSPEPKGTS